MTIAWTTLIIVALLLPGVFFLAGLASRDRYSREIVRTTGMGEIALALVVALAIHLLLWTILFKYWGFIVEDFFWPIMSASDAPTSRGFVSAAADFVWRGGLYVLATAVISYGAAGSAHF